MGNSGVLLDLEEARKFLEKKSPVVGDRKFAIATDLTDYSRATPEAIEYLAENAPEDCFVVVGLSEVSVENAKALAGWGAFLCFANLQSLDVEAAAIFAENGIQLCFEGGLAITPGLAGVLAASGNLLHLEMDRLAIEVANELVKHTHELTLALKVPPTAQVLDVLCGHAGYRLHVYWKRPQCSEPCSFSSPNNKKAFVVSRLYKTSGEWFENVYILDPDFHPEKFESHSEIIDVFESNIEIAELS